MCLVAQETATISSPAILARLYPVALQLTSEVKFVHPFSTSLPRTEVCLDVRESSSERASGNTVNRRIDKGLSFTKTKCEIGGFTQKLCSTVRHDSTVCSLLHFYCMTGLTTGYT